MKDKSFLISGTVSVLLILGIIYFGFSKSTNELISPRSEGISDVADKDLVESTEATNSMKQEQTNIKQSGTKSMNFEVTVPEN